MYFIYKSCKTVCVYIWLCISKYPKELQLHPDRLTRSQRKEIHSAQENKELSK